MSRTQVTNEESSFIRRAFFVSDVLKTGELACAEWLSGAVTTQGELPETISRDNADGLIVVVVGQPCGGFYLIGYGYLAAALGEESR